MAKRAKATPERLLKKKLWELCKQLIRELYGNECFTCGRIGLSGSNWHTGHFLPSSTCGAYLRYDLRNLRPQCYACNIHLGGNGAAFYKAMVEDVGQKEVDQIFKDKQKIVKVDRAFYETRIKSYTKVLEQVKAEYN